MNTKATIRRVAYEIKCRFAGYSRSWHPRLRVATLSCRIGQQIHGVLHAGSNFRIRRVLRRQECLPRCARTSVASTARLRESVIIVLIAAGAVIHPNPSFAQEQTPTTTTPTDTSPLRKLDRMDLRHPLHVGSDYYPKQSLKNHEQGNPKWASLGLVGDRRGGDIGIDIRFQIHADQSISPTRFAWLALTGATGMAPCLSSRQSPPLQ